jgi:hypothetical protein
MKSLKKKKLKKIPVPPADKDELLTRKNIKLNKKGGMERAKPPLRYSEAENYESESPYKLEEMNNLTDKQNTMSPVHSSPLKQRKSGSSHNMHPAISEGASTFSNHRKHFRLPPYKIPEIGKKRSRSAFAPFMKPVIPISNLSNIKDKSIAEIQADRRKQ